MTLLRAPRHRRAAAARCCAHPWLWSHTGAATSGSKACQTLSAWCSCCQRHWRSEFHTLTQHPRSRCAASRPLFLGPQRTVTAARLLSFHTQSDPTCMLAAGACLDARPQHHNRHTRVAGQSQVHQPFQWAPARSAARGHAARRDAAGSSQHAAAAQLSAAPAAGCPARPSAPASRMTSADCSVAATAMQSPQLVVQHATAAACMQDVRQVAALPNGPP